MKALKFGLAAGAVVLAGVLDVAAQTQPQTQPQPASAGTQATAAASDMTDAEVRKVDKANRKITLKHGAIKSLDMPPMTMVFQVSDVALLDKLQPGDKVRFKATNDAGKFTVTEIQPAN